MIIKVCGMRDPENIRQVTKLGIDWIGLIFYKKSKRIFTPQPPKGGALSPLLWRGAGGEVECPPFRGLGGVFVNASVDEMTEKASLYKLDFLQLHGEESPEICQALQNKGYTIIKAFSVGSANDLKITARYEGVADYFLFDTKCESYGGSGKRFDWKILSAYNGKTPFLLSGGINPDSLEDIKNFRHPQWAGIDLNSGFETEPGLKDIKKLELFISALK